MVQTPEKTRPRLFLIDGYALIYRAFFAMINRPLLTSKGENSSAAFGFTRFLINILRDHQPDYLGVVLDAGTSNREVLYPAYKATREKMPDDLKWSLPRIRGVIEGFNIPILELENHEADDVIGTLAKRAVEQGLEAVIVSGDKDFYQLIAPHICLLNPGRGGQAQVEEEWIGVSNASERLGVPPEHVIDYLALIGDSSDNIPGARGIGPKTAISLIEEYGSVENILANVEHIKQKRPREALIEHAADVLLSKQLVTIMDALPVELDLEALKISEPDREALSRVFLELEFHSFVRDYAPKPEETVKFETTYEVADTPALVATLAARARAIGSIALRTESNESLPMRGDLVGLSIALGPGDVHYLPLGHYTPGVLDLDGVGVRNLPPLTSPELKQLRDVLEDETIRKSGHDLKQDLIRLRRQGVTLRGIEFDAMLASYVLDPSGRQHDIDALALQHLNYRTSGLEEVIGDARHRVDFAAAPMEHVVRYAAERADMALRLREIFEPELDRFALTPLYRNVELALLEVLADMEWAGIKIDRDFFHESQVRLTRDLDVTQREIFRVAGEEFNINSTPQLRTILFEKLQYPVISKTKTGPSTDVSVLQTLADQGYELPLLLMDFRQLDKLKGTYVDALPQLADRNGRIHTTFAQAVAATGRLSSNDPNLQNIPIRTERGAELRKGFVPEEGFSILGADYSQIELRILAHMSGDPAFVTAFRSGLDIHRQTAAIMFGVADVAQVTSDMRAAAKTVNFATIYGIGAFALSDKLGTTRQEAQEFIQNYFVRFPDVRRYLDTMIEKAKELGYVETLSGRRRYVPEIHSRNFNIRSFGERVATNAPVQGSAADIIKIAMINIHDALREQGAGARMLLQVHDELLFEVPSSELETTTTLVRSLMVNAFPLDVPLEVVTGAGTSWYETK
ncbi:MAG: DNA polymerase I [Longimicrobiales bacterium]